MPTYSKQSLNNLNTCDPKLIRIMREVIKKYDNTIVWGHRGEAAQNEAFALGHSQKTWPNSKHNSLPSRAIDVVPYPTMYADIPEFYRLATYIFAEAAKQGVRLVWGGHWINFKDYAHWELHADERRGNE